MTASSSCWRGPWPVWGGVSRSGSGLGDLRFSLESPNSLRLRAASCRSSSANKFELLGAFARCGCELLLQLENLPNQSLVFALEELCRLSQLLTIEIVYAERHALSCSQPRSKGSSLYRTSLGKFARRSAFDSNDGLSGMRVATSLPSMNSASSLSVIS